MRRDNQLDQRLITLLSKDQIEGLRADAKLLGLSVGNVVRILINNRDTVLPRLAELRANKPASNLSAQAQLEAAVMDWD